MKPNFALNITDSAISLLHRTPRGWLEIGSANFDAPDLDEALGYLRASALGLSPHGITTKLILPPSQILYVEVEATGPDKAARETQIRAALKDRTPYAVDDLVFDWWGTGPKIKVAVVARETLEEAEAFAETHRFNPVSFVTTPAEGQFAGEPWFGATKLSSSILPEGEKVTRDQDPVKVVAREMPKPDVPVKQAADKIAQDEAEKADDDAVALAKAEAAAKVEADAKAQAVAKEIEDAKAKALAAQKEAVEKQAVDALKAEQEREAAEQAEADQKAKDEAQKRAEAAEAESIRKTEAAKAEMERRAQELAQAEAKRMVQDAEKAKADQISREKAKAAFIEAERKRTDLERVAAETAVKSADPFTGVIDQNIAEGKGLQAEKTEQETTKALGMAAFASRRADTGSAAPALGPAAVANLAKELTAASNANAVSDANNMTPGLPARKPAAPTVTTIAAPKPAAAPARAPAPTPPQPAAKPASTKPLNGMAAFATGAKAEMPKPAKDAIAAAKVTAARIPGAGAALARFKSKAQKSDAVAQAKRQAAAAKPIGTKTTGTNAAGPNTAFEKSLGAFGAKTAPRRGKPRFLGLILTLVLLAALAAIAAWSSLYLSRDTGAPETVQQADATSAPLDGTASAELSTAGTAAEVVTPAEAQAEAEAELPPADEVAATVQPDTQPPAAEMIAGADLPETGPSLAKTEGNAQAEGSGLGPQDEIFLAATDQAQPSFDAIALPRPISRPDTAPTPATAPPPFGTQYEFEPDGTIKATSKGVIMPDGFWLIAAKPPVLPPARPAAISGPVSAAPDTANAATSPPNAPSGTAVDPANASTSGILRMEGTGPSSAFTTDATVENRRPKGRSTVPALAAPTASPDDDAALATDDPALARLTSLRPLARSKTVLAAAEDARQAVEAASLAAKAAADEKAAQEQVGRNGALTVALSPRPAARPRDFSGAVEAAIAAASREAPRQVIAPKSVPEPEEADEPEVKVAAAPRIPTHANVAQQATFKNAINLSTTNLIGVYGSDGKRYALIRSASGRYSKVKVGDRLDGGTVAAITSNEVRYKKGSRMLSLSMPNG